MSDKKVKNSRELGLEVAALCGRHFLKLEHLHYGYWKNGLDIDISNLHIAQENYTDYLVSHVPEGVGTILDVGCGTGQNAKRLTDMGYKVDCVSPSQFLTTRASELLGDNSKIFECKFEQLETDNRYDLILFSESFQYINLEKALQQITKFLNPNGHLLICDAFKKSDMQGSSLVGGGRDLNKFYEAISAYPFELITDEDITEQTAPNIEILNDMLSNVAAPIAESTADFLKGRYPLIMKFIQWKYRKKIEQTQQKYLQGRRTADDFKKFKTYRLFLYKKIDQT